MRKTIFAVLIATLFGVGGLAYGQTRAKTSPAGIWSGIWSGGSTGKFEMTIRREAPGRFSGSMTVTPDRGDEYAAPIRLLEAKGSKLSVKFRDPNDEVEVTLQGVIEGASFKGEYTIRAKVSEREVETGAFTANRK
jgi:hypothetical protein